MALLAALALPVWSQETPGDNVEDALVIARTEDGAISIAGTLPSAEVERTILDHARWVVGEGLLTTRLSIAPDEAAGDIGTLALKALDTLGMMLSGTARLGEDRAMLDGTATDAEARKTALAALEDTRWVAEIGVALELADPYMFTASKTGDSVDYHGHAPDEETAAAVEAAIDRIVGVDATGELTLARGDPPGWPALVEAALDALTEAESGTLDIANGEVALTASLSDNGAHRRMVEKLQPGWTVDLSVLDTAPDPELVLSVAPDGALSARGRLPAALGDGALAEMLGPVDTSAGLAFDGFGNARPWRDALDALAIAVPRMARGEVLVEDTLARFEGALQPGFSAADLAAALRTTLGPDWEIEIALDEAPPPSHLDIIRTVDGVDIDGILPQGVTAEELLAPLGEADASDVTMGGRGDPQAWERKIRLVAEALQGLETGLARIEGQSVAVSGTLAPGHDAAEIAADLESRLGPDWTVSVDAREPDLPQDGEQLAARDAQGDAQAAEPDPPDFEPSLETCRKHLDEATGEEPVSFVAGEAELDPDQGALLDRLATLIGHCLGEDGLALEVHGHTDDLGDDAENLLLSRARALAVVLALSERGVPARRLRALGFGETRPIADNSTEEGRARNRRIEFNWKG